MSTKENDVFNEHQQEIKEEKMNKTATRSKIDLKLLLEEMDSNHWTSNAIEYVERAVNSHEALLTAAKDFLKDYDSNHGYMGAVEVLRSIVDKAEGN